MSLVSRSVLLLLHLLLEMVLFTSVALAAEERQGDVAARVEVPTRILPGAADEAPQPPQNLVVFPQSDTSIMLTWSQPSDTTDFDHYLVYVEDEDMETTTDYTYYIFNNLEPCTDYTFGVMSASAAGDTSDPLLGEGQTEARTPPAPQNLQVDGYTSTTVTLSWDKPDTLCDAEEYRVRWSTDGTDTQSTTTSETSFTVTGLSINTIYIFSVFARTSYGEGPEATVQQTTDATVGGPPENLVAVGVSSSAINVSWSPPADEPDYYVVSSFSCDVMEERVSGLSYLITGRDPCETCQIYVTSYYDDTQEYTASVSGATDAEDPPPPASCSVQVDGAGLRVTWVKAVSDCSLGQDRVQWTGTKLWGDGGKESGSVTTAGTTLYIDTVPYSQYTFEISSSIDGVFGSPSSCSGTSSETQPGSPGNVAVESEQGGVVVTWETPVEENGDIVNYGIFVDEETTPQETVSGDVHTASLELGPCQTFDLSVKAENGWGWGLPSEVKNVTSEGNGAPPPESCTVQVLEGALNVMWQEPDSNCPLGIYNASWTGTKLWGDEEKEHGDNTTLETMFTLLDPVPYSLYTFEISASTDGVFGIPVSCNGTSQETEPGSPVIVEVDYVQGEVVVTWETPAEENGRIVEYGIFTDGATVPQKNVSGNVHSTSLKLDPCETHSLSIKAKNGAGWGPPSEAKDVTVVDDVLPETVDCSASDFNVEVCWDPYDETCPVSQYNLVWVGDVLWSEELVDSNSTSLEWSTDRTCQSIAGLPYTTYYVELTVGSGTDYKNCSVTTPMAAPGPPADVSVTTEDLTIHVTWHEPEEKNGVIAFYQVEWAILNGDDSSQSTDATFYDIRGLECGVTVDVTVRAQVEEVDEFGERSSPQRAHLVNSVENLDCEPAGSGQVSLSWTVTDPECPISSYNVTWVYESLWSDNRGQGWQDAGKDETSTDVTSLPPYANVSIQVHVDNNPEYTECYAITPEEKPGPPVIVAVDSVQGEAVITWETPANENGLIAEYGIFVDEATEPQKTVSGDVHITSLELEPCKTFGLSVKAKNGAGWGTPSEVKNVTLVDDVPVPPENCSVQVEESVLTVTWERPDNACVQGTYSYRVDWTSTKLWGNGEVESDSKNTTATNTSVVDPVPYCEYLFNVSSSVNGVIGKQSAACGGTSLEAPASPPTDLVQVAMDISSVTVQWSLPESLRGRLLGWYLNWTTAIGHYLGEQDVTNPEERMLQIGDLDPSEVYNVYVMAVNGAGKGELAMLEASTEYVP